MRFSQASKSGSDGARNDLTLMTLDYPTAADIHAIHDRIIANSEMTESGIRTPEAVESAIVYISEGYFGEAPDTIHEKAAHLLRLIAADHPYVDGNKRTAMAAAVALYELNGYAFDPDDEIRAILRAFATDADSVDMTDVVSYLETHTTERS